MTKNILFVCVENAGRSQIAEAFFKCLVSGRFNVSSAGTTPSSQLNPFVVQVMSEIGIDITKHVPKLLSDSMIENSYKIVSMGCMDKEMCPSLYAKDIIDWNIPDPKEKSLDEVREIREIIKYQVMCLVKTLDGEN